MQECKQCGEAFYPLWGSSESPPVFCGKSCHNDWMRRHRVERTCETCGKKFDRPPAYETRQPAKYCSHKCSATVRQKRPLDRDYNGKPALLDRDGYVRIWCTDNTYPSKPRGAWRGEHRVVMEQFLGRALRPDEHVHHINGVKDDNRLENLVVMDQNDHARLSSHDYRAEVEAMKGELLKYREQFGALD